MRPTGELPQPERYRLEQPLGRGGMAEVFRATDLKLGRTVAIKKILPAFADQPQFVERFLREARLVAALEHPNILPIYDYGEEHGVPFLVMPFIEGGTLAARIGRPPRVTPAEAAAWIARLADALDTAHAAGILHRDVKSSNVLLDRAARPILADFGLARTVGASSDLTATGVLMGTPIYMAPELAQGQSASAASDLYALAVLAYEVLTGGPPFLGESPVATLQRHVAEPAPAASPVAPGLSAQVDDVLALGLAKSAADRPASCRAFAEALTAAIERPAAIAGVARRHRSPESRRRTRRALVYGVTGLLAVAVAVALKSVPPRSASLPAPGTVAVREPSRDRAPVIPPDGGVAKNAGPNTGDHEARSELAAATTALDAEPPGAVPLAGGDSAGASTEGDTTSPGPVSAPDSGPDHPLRRIAQQLRRPSRLGQQDFRELDEWLTAASARQPSTPVLAAMQAYVRGGLAYAAGDDVGARSALESARSAMASSTTPSPAPLWLTPGQPPADELEDWELAVIFGDARGEGLASVEARLSQAPEDARARLNRAQLLHIAGDHRGALDDARHVQRIVLDHDGQAAAMVSVLVGDELADLDRLAEAVESYHEALAGSPPARRAAVAAVDGLADRLQDPAAVAGFYREACRRGEPLACRRTESERPDRRRR